MLHFSTESFLQSINYDKITLCTILLGVKLNCQIADFISQNCHRNRLTIYITVTIWNTIKQAIRKPQNDSCLLLLHLTKLFSVLLLLLPSEMEDNSSDLTNVFKLRLQVLLMQFDFLFNLAETTCLRHFKINFCERNFPKSCYIQ